ncbi:pyridoxal-phosphate dependent enzyme domain-containing protein [Ditylenchus destructor]|nr:pyridoxal-phosphate dependent enzyme domain-containing protein [Ditylenchus destructor]
MRRVFVLTITFILISFTLQEETLENVASSEDDPDDYVPYIRPEISNAPADSHTSYHANSWRHNATEALWRERSNMSHTPIINLKLNGAKIVLKNESASESESLKHRFAWALVMWAVLRGHIQENTIVYEASSGNTAASEAYIKDETKVKRIEKFGGKVHKVQNESIEHAAEKAAKADPNGFYMNQFGNADAAEEYHFTNKKDMESSNVFYEILIQLNVTRAEIRRMSTNSPSPVDYFVHTAGTGGTLSSVGKFIKTYKFPTKVILADTQYSIYYDMVINKRFMSPNESAEGMPGISPGISGTASAAIVPYGVIGKTTSLMPSVIDRAIKVPDLASTAAMHVLFDRYDIHAGPSTGVSFLTSLHLISTHKRDAKDGRRKAKPLVLATILSDPGSNYEASYYNMTWIEKEFENHGGFLTFDCWYNIIANYVDAETKYNSGVLESPLVKGDRECPAPSSLLK